MGRLDDAAAQARSLHETGHRPYPLPLLSTFLELNCRTYVCKAEIEAGGGVFHARPTDGGFFGATYHDVGMPTPPKRATLEHFLTERYCLYASEGELRARTSSSGRPSGTSRPALPRPPPTASGRAAESCGSR